LTQSGFLVGTPGYMAPEQAGGQRALVGPATDVYALGVVLYQLLTGQVPFRGDSALEVLRAVTNDEPVRPRRLQPRLPRDLEAITLHCLEKAPGRRYPTALALAEDLQRFREGRQVAARPVGAAARVARWCRRKPVIATLLVLLAATVLLGLAGVLWQWRHAVEERHAAENARDTARWQSYRADVAAAASALQLNDVGAARAALEDAPEEYRNWEWNHFYSQLDNARAVLRGAEGDCWDVAFRPGGRRAVACFADNTIRVWDAATGREAGVLRSPGEDFRAPQLNPDGTGLPAAAQSREGLRCRQQLSPDGTRVAAAATDGSLCVWEMATGKCLAVPHGGPHVCEVRWSPDGRLLAFALTPGPTVRLWDAATGHTVLLAGGHTDTVDRLRFTPDGRQLASAGKDGAVCLWDVTAARLLTVLRGHTGGVSDLAFSPDGRRLVSGADYPDNTARLWDLTTGEQVAVLAGHLNTVGSVAFSPDGKRIITASWDQAARLWDGTTGKLIAPLEGHTGPVRSVAFAPTGGRVVTASEDQTLRLWDAATGQSLAVLHGHLGAIVKVAYSPDGALLASASEDGTARLWDAEYVERNGVLRGHTSFVYDAGFSPDGTRVASAAWDHTVRLWDATTGRQTGLLRHEADIIESVAFSPDGRQLASMARDDKVRVWDVVGGTRRHVLAIPPGGSNTDVRLTFNAQGTLLAAGSRAGPVCLWDAATGRPAGKLQGHTSPSRAVAFSPDGSRLASGDEGGTVRVWDVAARAPVAVLRGYTAAVNGVVYSADGRLLATASYDKSVRLWDAGTGELLGTLRHGGIVYGVAFSPDGTRLASGCGDNTIRLWDVARQQEVAELRGHGAYVHAVAFSADGTRLLSASGDATVRVWDTVPAAQRLGPWREAAGQGQTAR
jgi:WD40 repeat protein